MFCKTAHCALIVMMTLTCDKSRKGLTLAQIAKQNNIPLSAFEGVSEILSMCGFVKVTDNILKLEIRPEETTVWEIVKAVSGENLFQGDFYDGMLLQHRLPSSSISTIINKERELVMKIIEGRFCRYKLSKWSEKASKTVYI